MPRPADFEFETNWPIPNDYLLELGRATVLWSTLESAVNVAISKLAGFDEILDERAVIMLAHASFRQRIDILGALCDRLAPGFPHLREHKSVVSLVKRAQASRNAFAHNELNVDPETGEVRQSSATARGKLKFKTQAVQLAAVIDVSADIHEAISAVIGLTTGKKYPLLWERDSQPSDTSHN